MLTLKTPPIAKNFPPVSSLHQLTVSSSLDLNSDNKFLTEKFRNTQLKINSFLKIDIAQNKCEIISKSTLYSSCISSNEN